MNTGDLNLSLEVDSIQLWHPLPHSPATWSVGRSCNNKPITLRDGNPKTDLQGTNEGATLWHCMACYMTISIPSVL